MPSGDQGAECASDGLLRLALREAIRRYGLPEISTTDTGSQFTSVAFGHRIGLSMNGKGCGRAKVFIERFWRALKYDDLYAPDGERGPTAAVKLF